MNKDEKNLDRSIYDTPLNTLGIGNPYVPRQISTNSDKSSELQTQTPGSSAIVEDQKSNKSSRFTLVVVDEQVGFAKPSGRLYVKGGETSVNNTVDFINKNHKNINEVIFTVDFHNYNTESYTEPNIEWPTHCMAYSEDAGIITELIQACIDNNLPIKVFIKGNCDGPHTEYGAFEKIGTFCQENGDLSIVVNNRKNDCSINIKSNNIVICGIAGDYCVLNTIKNLIKYQGPVELNISIFKDGIASIDGGTAINQFILENNLNVI